MFKEALKKVTSPLEKKVLLEYEKMVHAYETGYTAKYDHILNCLTFIEMGSKTSNPVLILNYLINK